MSGGGSSASYKLRNLFTFLHRYKLCPRKPYHQGLSRDVMLPKFGQDFPIMHQGLRFFNAFPKPFGTTEMVIDGKNKVQPPDTTPPNPTFSQWAKWLLGSILTLVLPFWQKWQSLLRLEGKVEKAVEEVETVAETVEVVAIKTEKISAEVAEKLPADGKLKEAALMVEHAASVTANDAHTVQVFIHKVADLEQDLKDLEKIAEPVIDKIAEEVGQRGN